VSGAAAALAAGRAAPVGSLKAETA
jgi:hypothetical protein